MWCVHFQYFTLFPDQWCQSILDAPNDHPMQALLAQKFFKYFTAQCNSGTPRIGRYFFEGVINTHYFGKLVTKLKTIENTHKNSENGDSEHSNEMLYKMFKAYGLWLQDMCILDETLHIPSLAPNMMPELVTEVFGSSKRLPFDIIDFEEIDSSSLDFANEWKRLHFRLKKIPTALLPSAPQSCVFKIQHYDSPLPLPANNPNLLMSIELSDTWFTNESAFMSAVQTQINTLLSYAKQYDDQRREYGSLLFSIIDLVSGLYVNEDSELWTKGSCMGTIGPKGQKFECAGSAAICHRFCQAKLQSQVELRLNEHRDARTALVQDVSQPIQLGVILASSLLDCFVEHLMKMYFRHLSLNSGKGSSSSTASLMHYHQLGIRLFYLLCDCLGEETNACPLMRHLLTSCLEKLGQAMVSENPNQCLPLLQRIVAQPDFAHFLTSVFTPSCATVEVFFQMYKCIGDLPDTHSSMTFTLLSKMSVDSWCGKNPDSKAVSRLLSSVGENLKRTGPDVNAGRLLIHDLHRSHLITLAKYNFPAHYDETICLLLVLTEANCLDPQLWLDLVNMHLSGQNLNLKSTTKELVDSTSGLLFRDSLAIDIEETEVCHQLIKDHFNKERRSVGLHGLYSKYRKYGQPLAMFMGLNCCMHIELKKRQGHLQDISKQLFDWILCLFEAWILPLMEGQRQETAAWIQQFAESSKVLFPWAPGDVAVAETVLSVFTGCLNYLDMLVLDGTPNARGVTPWLLEVYCQRYAKPTIKDFVLNPVHNQWLSMAWTKMYPTPQDLNLIVAVMDSFIPLCHEFLGKVFVQLPWKQIFTADSTLSKEKQFQLAPYLLHIVVKLSAGNS